MEKKACIDFLNQKGYLTQETDGVVTIQLGDLPEKERNHKIAEISELITAKGYTGSYGFRWKNDAAVAKTSSGKKDRDFDLHFEEVPAEKSVETEKTAEDLNFELDESGEGQMSFLF